MQIIKPFILIISLSLDEKILWSDISSISIALLEWKFWKILVILLTCFSHPRKSHQKLETQFICLFSKPLTRCAFEAESNHRRLPIDGSRDSFVRAKTTWSRVNKWTSCKMVVYWGSALTERIIRSSWGYMRKETCFFFVFCFRCTKWCRVIFFLSVNLENWEKC